MTSNTEYCVPKQIYIDVTAACNLKCKFCPRPLNVHQHMDYDLFTSIIDRIVKEMPDATIIPWMNGEPLLHPRYYEMIHYIAATGMRSYVTTNGMIWDWEVFRTIATSPGFYQIIFSIDGISNDPRSRSIEVARPGSNRRVILDNIERFGRLKEHTGNRIDMVVKAVRRGQDWGEHEQFIAEWLRKSYIDCVCIGDTMIDYNEESMRIYPCQHPDNNFLCIKYDGLAVACPINTTMVNDPKWAMGQVDKTTPLLELYNSGEYRRFRKHQRNGTFCEPCSHCGFAYTGYGMAGSVKFRDPTLVDLGTVYYHRDHYNSFFSLVDKRKPNAYYLQGGQTGRGGEKNAEK